MEFRCNIKIIIIINEKDILEKIRKMFKIIFKKLDKKIRGIVNFKNNFFQFL
jgi:hypothetical protein